MINLHFTFSLPASAASVDEEAIALAAAKLITASAAIEMLPAGSEPTVNVTTTVEEPAEPEPAEPEPAEPEQSTE